jgi:hypothetical protein
LTPRTRIVRRTGLLAVALTLALSGSSAAGFHYVTSWGSAGGSGGQFTQPFGIASDGDRTIYVADVGGGAHRVQRFDSGGTFLGAFGVPSMGSAPLFVAGHVAVDAAGSVYVTDRSDARVDKFTADGHPLLGWGTRGDGNGQFQDPAGVATDLRGNVYVVDRQANRVQRFAPDGTFDLTWGGSGTAPGQFSAAQDVAVDGVGNVYVVDSGADRVQRFTVTADGATAGESWGSAGAGEGQFNMPLGIATDDSGTVFVADTGNQRVQAFSSTGTFLEQFGSPGSGDGQFVNPVDVASDASGALFVVDRGNARVQKFAAPTDEPPPPEPGMTANIEFVSGIVSVRPPGASSFVPLKAGHPLQIPMGSLVQTSHGIAKLTTASDLHHGVQSAMFYAGLFAIRQRREAAPVTQIELAGGSFAVCSKSVARAARASRFDPARRGLAVGAAAKSTRKRSKKVVRRLWGDGKGRFRTKGVRAAATVRGTKWLTEDRCDGTLVRVERGRVEVRDFARKRTVIVTAGKSYLARRG